MNVSAIMTRRVKTCRPGDALAVAARIMRDQKCGFVPVTDTRRRVVGVITDRDVCLAMLRLDAALTEVRIEKAMTTEVRSVRPGDSLEEAEHTMRTWRVRRVPVLDAARKIVGVLSIDDLALAASEGRGKRREPISEREVTRTLSRIVRPARVIDVLASPPRKRRAKRRPTAR